MTAIAEDIHSSATCPMTFEAHSDVIEFFKHLREREPVHVTEKGVYQLMRYDDVYDALRDPVLFSSVHELGPSPVEAAQARSVIYSDDPDHVGLRKFVNRSLTPRGVLTLAERVAVNAQTAVDELIPGEPFDTIELGFRLAFEAFAAFLSIPDDEYDRLRAWAPVSGQFVRPAILKLTDGTMSEEMRAKFDDGYLAMRDHFANLLEQHRDHDLTECAANEGLTLFGCGLVDAARTDPGVIDTVLHRLMPPMTAGGTRTVSTFYANAVDVLLDNPEVFQAIREDPGLLDNERPSEVLEEMFRLKSVVQGLYRVATRDVEIRGTLIPKGSTVQLMYLSSDHDPEVFEDPEEFKDRGLSRHLAFGFGTHTCIGQSFVRLQLKTFLRDLAARFTRLERAPEGPTDWGGYGGRYSPDKLLVIGYDDTGSIDVSAALAARGHESVSYIADDAEAAMG